jgi:hypothetical protein
MMAAEASKLVGAVSAVPDKGNLGVGEADQPQSQKSGHDLSWGTVGSFAFFVLLSRSVQIDHHGQGPRASGAGYADQDGQDNPLVTVGPRGMGVGGSAGVTMPGFAVDFFALVAINGFVANEGDGATGSV